MTEKSDKCNCINYRPLELSRDQISKRITESGEILKTMESQAKTSDGIVLYKCKSCGRFWQKNVAWNWGGKEYLFQIPDITPGDWLNEQFMSPAEMLTFSALTGDYFKVNKFVESKRRCQKEECHRMALENNVLCRNHFIESLQRVGLLPKEPKGKIFEPYSK